MIPYDDSKPPVPPEGRPPRMGLRDFIAKFLAKKPKKPVDADEITLLFEPPQVWDEDVARRVRKAKGQARWN